MNPKKAEKVQYVIKYVTHQKNHSDQLEWIHSEGNVLITVGCMYTLMVFVT